jgi:hypothetical protein
MKYTLSLVIIVTCLTLSYAATPQQRKELRSLYPSVTHVKNLQKSLGFTGGDVDGVIGPKTFAAYQEGYLKLSTNNKNFVENKSGNSTAENLRCTSGGCLGKGRATTFNHSVVACPPFRANPHSECYGAISLQAAEDLCKGKNKKCYCNQIANLSVNGKKLSVPIKDVGAKTAKSIEFAKGVMIDITPSCVEKSGFGKNICRGGGTNTSCYGLDVSLQPNIQMAEIQGNSKTK